MSRLRFITIQGPTASGKSSLALKLAKALSTEIISADSRQIYKFMDIGTAKPTYDEMKEVNHHMIDVVDPNEVYNAGRYYQDAEKIISSLNSSGMIPIVAGGTGFYIKSLKEGLFESPDIPENIISFYENILKEKGSNYLYRMLIEADPSAADRIHPNDTYRVQRALHIWKSTGVTQTEHWEKQKSKSTSESFDIFINIDREILYSRINTRINLMLNDGLINEIRNIHNMGFDYNCPGFSSIGYKEFLPYIKGESPLDDCAELARQHTRNYAKRQLTWFRKLDFDLTILVEEYNFYSILEQVKSFVTKQNI